MKTKSKFIPRFSSFTLAGMPHRDVDRACQVIMRNFPEVLTIPRLTRSLRLYLEGLPGLKVDSERRIMSLDFAGKEAELAAFYERYLADDIESFAISDEWNVPMRRLAELIRAQPAPERKFILFVAPGPYTFGGVVRDDKGAPAFYNDAMRDVLVKQLIMKIKWRQKQIKQLFPGLGVLVSLGEAGLALYATASGAGSWQTIEDAINEVIGAAEGVVNIHCCANIDWSLLMRTNTDIVNTDAYQFGNMLALYPDALGKFLGRGGSIAWGIVPTSGVTGKPDIENETPDSLVARLEQMINALVEKGVDRRTLLEASWVTPACETATLSVELADKVYDFTRQVSERMKQKYSA